MKTISCVICDAPIHLEEHEFEEDYLEDVGFLCTECYWQREKDNETKFEDKSDDEVLPI